MNQQHMWMEFQKLFAAQQLQQMVMQQFKAYNKFCQMNGLNIEDQNSFNLFYQNYNNYTNAINNNIFGNPQTFNNFNNNNLNYNNNNFSNNNFSNNNNFNNFNNGINNNINNFNNNFTNANNNFNNVNNNFNNFNNNVNANNNNINNNNNLNNNSFININQNLNNNNNNVANNSFLNINQNLNNNVANNSFLNINQNLNNNENLNDNENVFNNNGNIYIPNSLEEIIPRKEETIYMNKEKQNQPNTINIMFASEKGYNLMMTSSKFITFKQLFKDYMKRLGLPDYHIGVNIQFTYNQKRLNPNSHVQIGEILRNTARIDVLDLGGLQGALK